VFVGKTPPPFTSQPSATAMGKMKAVEEIASGSEDEDEERWAKDGLMYRKAKKEALRAELATLEWRRSVLDALENVVRRELAMMGDD
jgi:hypothetical protein